MQCTKRPYYSGCERCRNQITAPFKVSGTAALTGLMKAYETTTSNKAIPEEVKSSQ